MAVTKIDHIELIVNRFEEYVALSRARSPPRARAAAQGSRLRRTVYVRDGRTVDLTSAH